MFQSLFLWNSRPDGTKSSRIETSYPGFNPCFCGTRARTLSLCSFGELDLRFQSLFLWNSRPDTISGMIQRYGYVPFQSLFLWNSRPDGVILVDVPELDVFQSLFLWNSRPDSGRFSSFSLFLGVKPVFSDPPSGMRGIYRIPYKFIPAGGFSACAQTPS